MDASEILGADPIEVFGRLFAKASASERFDATRAALATADAEGRPSVRFVLVREHGADGFVFYTDYRSPKCADLAARPRAALAWHWESLGVQVRVEGAVRRAEPARSDAYFARRPRGSQLGAWASHQSQPIESRDALDARVDEVAARFGDGEVPRPEHWGGWVVMPEEVELWFAHEARLHDRYRFRRAADGWSGERLCP